MHTSTKTFLRYLGLIIGLSCFSPFSFASLASDMRVVIVSPFTYSEEGVPQNVKNEMSIDIDLPQGIVDYFTKVDAFKSVALAKFEPDLDVEADWVVHGEVLYVQGGSGAARYFGSPSGAGRASVLIGIKVFNTQGELLHEGRASQEGTQATTALTAWSNKGNINSAIKVIPQRILAVVIGGDLETPEGIVYAVKSGNALAIRAAAQASHDREFYRSSKVTDAMESVVLQAINDNNRDRNFIDSMAWCLINIGKSGDNKYTASLEKIINSNAHNKIKRHARSAHRSIAKANK